MKPEELDRLFREELEKLDQVPGVEWNDETAWNKINISLKGGWNPAWTMGISVITVVVGLYIVYRVFLPQETSVIPGQKNIPAAVMKEKEVRKEENILAVKERKNIVRPVASQAVPVNVLPADTAMPEKIMPERVVEYYPQPAPYLSGPRLTYIPLAQQPFTFTMPQQSAYNMSVNNSFNFSNLFKSIDAQKNGENFYYIYEYNNSFPSRIERYPYAYPGTNTRRAFIIDYNK